MLHKKASPSPEITKSQYLSKGPIESAEFIKEFTNPPPTTIKESLFLLLIAMQKRIEKNSWLSKVIFNPIILFWFSHILNFVIQSSITLSNFFADSVCKNFSISDQIFQLYLVSNPSSLNRMSSNRSENIS